MISLIKKPKKNTCKSKYSNNLNVERNVLFYANLKRKHHLSTHKVSFPEQAKLFGHFCKEYSGLSNVEKHKYLEMWKAKKRLSIEQKKQKTTVDDYNSTLAPLYKTL